MTETISGEALSSLIQTNAAANTQTQRHKHDKRLEKAGT